MQNSQVDGMNAEGGLPTSAVSEITASNTKDIKRGCNLRAFPKSSPIGISK